MIEQLSKLGFKKDPNTSVWILEEQHNFSYSDGDGIENYLLDSIRSCQDKSTSSTQLTKFIRDWPTLYHLSRRRSNIIRSFSTYLKGKNVLEIGCGCGALSRYLGEIGANLLAVEGSPRRALITRERCKDLANVEVVAATSDLVSGLREFDVVILNGVLEYSTMFMGVNGPSILLGNSFKQLTKSGILILAIENQLGLKYFSGQPEDHAGQPMYGINNSYREGEFKTWGKIGLTDLLKEAGFETVDQFIPLPDYKLPISVITPFGWENYASELSSLAVDSVLEDPQRTPYDLFSLEKAYLNTWRNGLAGDLANSFLMVANKSHLPSKIVPSETLAFQFKDDQKIGLNRGIEIIKNGNSIFTKSFPLDSQVNESYSQMSEFVFTRSYWLELLEIVNRPNWSMEEVLVWFRNWISALLLLLDPAITKDWNLSVSARFWEMTPLNTYRDKNGTIQFSEIKNDSPEKIPFSLVVYHGIKVSLLKILSVSKFKANRDITYLEIFDFILGNFELLKNKDLTFLFLEEQEQKIDRLITGKDESCRIDYSKFLQQRDTVLELRSKITELQSQISSLQNELILICKSQSWRYTEPLRKFLKFLKPSS